MKSPLRLAACLAALISLLTACGGGTSQLEAFVPGRVIAFGDEHSAFTAAGRKYSVNALATDGTIDCETNPLWIQTVATVWGYKYAQCQGTATEVKAFTRAAVGATVADVATQIDAQAALGFVQQDLVLMMAGLHDVRRIYESRTSADTEAQLIDRARAAGIAMGQQVNRVIGLGPKVIVATMPDLGLTPYALAKGTADAGLLTRLSAAFNGRLRVTILNDGRYVGLVLADEMLQSAVQVPAGYSLTNVVDAACKTSAALPDCTTDATSLVDGASASTWLWADSLRFGPTAHRQIGTIAASRAQTNPF